ncbi:hypothetical protein F2Q70_00022023 [Brassica cretica]|uniref:Uncharacterized protein n=1 Tax=Brassica cretica TaxID=69181 RepID=A0A8S9GKT2_BRACR|nr:hypothetical protein F2Q70_00022023 [Brassica cretica]
MGKGSWSRRQHMTEARSSTEASRRVVRQVCQVMMQYLLFRCSRGCIMIKHEETDGWRMHNSWGRKAWCGAHLVGEKSTFGVEVSRWGTWLQRGINLCSLLLVKSPVSFHGIHIWRYEEEFRWICGDLEMLGTSKRIKLSGEEERWFSDRHVADGGTRLLFSNPENSKCN